MTAASVVVAMLLAAPESAARAPAPEPAATARLEVRAPPDCVTRSDLIERVAARSPRIEFVGDASAFAVRAVFTVAHAGSVTGELLLATPGGMPASRRLVTRSCAEAADAIALIIAVTLDPASAVDVPASSRPTRATDATPTGPGAPAAAPTLVGESSPTPPPSEPAPAAAAVPRAAAAPSAPPAASRRRFGAQLAGQLVSGPAPAVMPGLAAYALFGIDRDALWSPALLVGIFHAQRFGLAENGGTADFALGAFTLDACPIRYHRSQLEGRACAAGLLGQIAARGTQTYQPATVARTFAAAGVAAHGGLRLGARLELVARVGAGYSLIRDSFEFTPNVFHRVAPLTLAASLGLEFHEP